MYFFNENKTSNKQIKKMSLNISQSFNDTEIIKYSKDDISDTNNTSLSSDNFSDCEQIANNSDLELDLSTESTSISSTESLSITESSERIHILNIYNVINSLINLNFNEENKSVQNKFILKNIKKIDKDIKILKLICNDFSLNNYESIKRSIISFVKKNTKNNPKGKIKQIDMFNRYCILNNVSMCEEEFNNMIQRIFNLDSQIKDNELFWVGIEFNKY